MTYRKTLDLEFTFLNTGTATTFRRRGYRETIIDVTLATPETAGKIKEWKVLENYTVSDHQYISFKKGELAKRCNTKTIRERKKGWNVNKLTAAALIETIAKKVGRLPERNAPLASSKTPAENIVERTMSFIEHAKTKTLCQDALQKPTAPRVLMDS